MIKILFLIHDLAQGGAEKVLVNLANSLDKTRFDVTVMTLFDVGVNREFLDKSVTYKSCFKKMIRGNIHLMKVLSPKQLHKWLIKDKYDIEVSYLEGPSARVISGCTWSDTKIISWIHVEQHNKKKASEAFRSYREASECYSKFDKIVCVSKTVREDFEKLFDLQVPCEVYYNTVENEIITRQAMEVVDDIEFSNSEFKICAMGNLKPSKGFDRLARVHCKLRHNGFNIHTYLLGVGPEKDNIFQIINLEEEVSSFTFVGYKTNPYKYLKRCDLFVCASMAEGFSTAATEALIVGTPVVTTPVAGMEEMLGNNNEYGIISDMSEESLYEKIKFLLENPEQLEHYKRQAFIRGQDFSKDKTVAEVEKFFLGMV